MARIKPDLKIFSYGKLNVRPEETDFYYESKLQNKLFTKPPSWNFSDKPVELIAVHNHQEHQRMLELQEEFLEHDKNQEEINKNRIKEIFELQDQIRDHFKRSNNFLHDCLEKKALAKSNLAEERKLHTKFKNSISEMKDKIKALSAFRDVVKNVMKDLKPYEDVINAVAASSDNNWSSPKEVMDGCDALMMAQVDMIAMQKWNIRKIEFIRCKMLQITEEATQTVLGLNTELSELERSYHETHSECLRLEKIIANTRDSVFDNRLTKWRILNEINIMYKMLCRRIGVSPEVSKADFETQLNFIRDEMEVIRAVVKKCSIPRKRKPKKKFN